MDCLLPENTTAPTHESQLLGEVSRVIYGYVLPLVCMFGIIGNSLNITILTRRKLQKSFKALEYAANMCLIALAVSDCMFCLFAFPTTFLPSDNRFDSKGFLLYYQIYCTGFINIFILTSTWLTVTMSVERYLAICHPFKETFFLTIGKTKIIIVIVYILSCVFNIPVFWRYEVTEITCNFTIYYQPMRVHLGNSATFESIYRVLWAIVGNFVPLILLVGFNICLCRKIHNSYKFRQKFRQEGGQQGGQSDAGQTLTRTLVVIVVMFLILVAPSEIVMHIGQLRSHGNDSAFRTIEVIFNFMQSLNFSVNFVLYCIMSRHFRKTLRYLVLCKWYWQRRNDCYLEVSMKRVTFSNYTKNLRHSDL